MTELNSVLSVVLKRMVCNRVKGRSRENSGEVTAVFLLTFDLFLCLRPE